MMKRLVCAAITVCLTVLAAPVMAQSLGDLARQEEERRKTAKKAVKSFSNANLTPSEIAEPSPSSSAPTANCFESVKEGKCVEPEKVVANSEAEPTAADPQVKTTEATVRQQADSIRQRLAKMHKELDTLAVSADDPARSPGERAAAARMLEQRDRMLASIEAQWLALEKRVEDEGLPREWLGVRPVMSTRIPQ